jgi:Holliday junction resolvase RusA-like endonuclease
MPSETLRLHIPPYPCQRAQVANGRAYYKPAYQQWKQEAKKVCRDYWKGREPLLKIVKLSMQFYGWSRAYDLSNLFKSVEDAMVAAEILRDDNLTVIQHIESAWEKAPSKKEQFIDVYLEY